MPISRRNWRNYKRTTGFKPTHGHKSTNGGRKGHKLSAAGKARLSASLKAAAARRKAAGIKEHHTGHKMTEAQKNKLRTSLKAAAARRKALGLKRHISAATKAKMRARFIAYLHSPKAKAARHKAMMTRLANPAYRAKLRARAKARWAKLDPQKKRKIILHFLLSRR